MRVIVLIKTFTARTNRKLTAPRSAPPLTGPRMHVYAAL